MIPHHPRHRLARIGLLAGAGLVLAASSSGAQDYARNANIWDGFAHQPSRSGVRSAELDHGLLRPEAKRTAENNELESTYRTLERQALQNQPTESAQQISQ